MKEENARTTKVSCFYSGSFLEDFMILDVRVLAVDWRIFTSLHSR